MEKKIKKDTKKVVKKISVLKDMNAVSPMGKPSGKIFFIEPIAAPLENIVQLPDETDIIKSEPIKIEGKWGREDEDITGINLLNNKLDKIIGFLNSIESELIEFNTISKHDTLSVDETTSSIEDLSLETLFLLQKHAGDIIQRNNYPEGRYSIEMIAAQQRFEKLTSMITEKLNGYSWD